jgi:myosin heavy subunit
LLLRFTPFSSKVSTLQKTRKLCLIEVKKMDKALRVLAIIILVLAIVAMVFAQLSFMKRQVLLGRNSMFEEQVIKVAKTIEAADAPDVPAPDVQKDVAEVTEREVANPERTSVFENYPAKLETQNSATLDYSSDAKKRQLRSFYQLDAEGKYVLSTLDGKPKTDGPGTMAEILAEMLNRSIAQKAVLEKTRSELTKSRELVTALVTEQNKMKADWRVTKRELKDSRDECEKLKEEKAALEAQVAKLTAEKKELAAELADVKAEIEKKDIEITDFKERYAQLEQKYKDLIKNTRPGRQETGPGAGDIGVSQLTAGVKGKVVDANDEYKFVIIEFTDDAMVEMMGPERANPLPQLEMNVRRTGRQSASGEFVTRVRIRQAVRGKNLVVADILTDWQQVPVEKADVVFF